MSRAKRVFRAAWLAVALLFLVALAFGALQLGRFMKSTGTSPVGWWNIVRDPRGHFPAHQDRLNILLIGKDYNHDRRGIQYTKGARSDTLVVLSLDLENRKVSALSVPRDTYVEYPPGLPGRRDKVNAAYAWGGAELAKATVGRLLGETIHHHIALKADAVKTIVDELGGVEVEVLDTMKYEDRWAGLHIDLKPGRQIINGEQAVGFTRFRKVKEVDMLPDGRIVRLRNVQHSKEEGDERRMKRQQMLLRAMLRKAREPAVFLRADKLIETGLGAIETDLNKQQLYALAVLFKDVQPDQMQTASLAYKDYKRGGKWYAVPDERKVRAQVDWLLRGDESAANRLTVVEVKNGTTIPRLAGKVTEALRENGFDAKNGGNVERAADAAAQTTVLYGTAAVAPRARRVVEVLGGGRLAKLPPERVKELGEADVSVVVGRDIASVFAAADRKASLR